LVGEPRSKPCLSLVRVRRSQFTYRSPDGEEATPGVVIPFFGGSFVIRHTMYRPPGECGCDYEATTDKANAVNILFPFSLTILPQ